MLRRITTQTISHIGKRNLVSTASKSLKIKSVLPKNTQPISNSFIRFHSTNNGNPSNTAQLKVDKPEMMIAFTCKKCNTRSSHTMSKQAYTSGTVLITCPGCKSRHLIADHLKVSWKFFVISKFHFTLLTHLFSLFRSFQIVESQFKIY